VRTRKARSPLETWHDACICGCVRRIAETGFGPMSMRVFGKEIAISRRGCSVTNVTIVFENGRGRKHRSGPDAVSMGQGK